MAYYSGSQRNAFQRNAFQITSFGEQPPPDTIGGGGGGPINIKAYRKKLISLSRASDRRLYKKIEKRIGVVIAEAPTPAIAYVAREIRDKIDFEAIGREESENIRERLAALLIKLDQLLATAVEREMESEDELILMMAIV